MRHLSHLLLLVHDALRFPEPGDINTFSPNHAKQDTQSTYPDNYMQPPSSHKAPFPYPTADYSSAVDADQNAMQQSPSKMARNLSYSQPYHQPPPQEHYEPTHVQQHYPSHDMATYQSYQSYPSSNDNRNPATSTAPYATYDQSVHASHIGAPYVQQPDPRLQDLPPSNQYSPDSRNGAYREKPQPSAAFTYDCNYQPPPEKIAEAHKAARFAVGALAFDDVPVAVDFLRRKERDSPVGTRIDRSRRLYRGKERDSPVGTRIDRSRRLYRG
ncbi:Protein-like OF MAMMALIAN LYST-INTERACTING PROTEIN 5 [Nymphaea thermarum]|nr:Protein-like OF MAMMALIAN LYST-INTERACTING PROTEIN 5 [Nymphaea thermarum]